jgi:peptide/nickel transport system ATP-binding protein
VDPKVLVADEAVSMIDVSLRLGILALLSDLRSRLNISVVFITHDVASARYVAPDGQVCVIYRGEIVESGPTDALISGPVHPYTQALLSAMPVLRGLEEPGPDRYIPAQDLDLRVDDEGGCLFRARCRYATDRCAAEHPRLATWGEGERLQACFYPEPRHVVAHPVEHVS